MLFRVFCVFRGSFLMQPKTDPRKTRRTRNALNSNFEAKLWQRPDKLKLIEHQASRSLFSLRVVIFACSVAALCNSVAGSLPSRSRSIASISSALFPVAQTM